MSKREAHLNLAGFPMITDEIVYSKDEAIQVITNRSQLIARIASQFSSDELSDAEIVNVVIKALVEIRHIQFKDYHKKNKTY